MWAVARIERSITTEGGDLVVTREGRHCIRGDVFGPVRVPPGGHGPLTFVTALVHQVTAGGAGQSVIYLQTQGCGVGHHPECLSLTFVDRHRVSEDDAVQH